MSAHEDTAGAARPARGQAAAPARPREPLVELADVTKTFGSGPTATRVLDGVDLVLAAGEALAVLGPSGSGKSTLLNIIGVLEPPTAGQVSFDGRDLLAMDDDERARFRNRELGFVFQHHHLLPQLTALENVLLPTLAEGHSAAERTALRERAEALLERVGLAERRGHRPGALSGGERQRVAVVRALILGPRLVLADEPTGSLDARSADTMADLLVEVSERDGAALLVVTHSERLAERMSGAVVLDAGRLQRRAAAAR
ncbi:MAG: ABC transporter ATP-binding protein [Planctomycetota bacterium]